MSESVSEPTDQIDIVLPKQGLLYHKETVDYLLCKPKLIPLKSVTLEKLGKMQEEAELKLKENQEIDSTLDRNK